MDNDLISRSALRDQLGKYFFLYDGNDFMEVMRKVEKAPAVDPETLRPTGRWEECDWVEYDGYDECVHYPHKGCVCTNCRDAFKKEFVLDPRVDYCPNCGAKMEG